MRAHLSSLSIVVSVPAEAIAREAKKTKTTTPTV